MQYLSPLVWRYSRLHSRREGLRIPSTYNFCVCYCVGALFLLLLRCRGVWREGERGTNHSNLLRLQRWIQISLASGCPSTLPPSQEAAPTACALFEYWARGGSERRFGWSRRRGNRRVRKIWPPRHSWRSPRSPSPAAPLPRLLLPPSIGRAPPPPISVWMTSCRCSSSSRTRTTRCEFRLTQYSEWIQTSLHRSSFRSALVAPAHSSIDLAQSHSYPQNSYPRRCSTPSAACALRRSRS